MRSGKFGGSGFYEISGEVEISSMRSMGRVKMGSMRS